MKIRNLILSLLVVLILVPHQVNAGVVKEMVEVDEAQRIFEEQERIRLQEEYKKEAMEQAQVPEVQPPVVIEETARDLREKEIDQRNQVVETVTTTVKTSCSACDIVQKILGATFGVPVGAVMGLVRGSAAKGTDLAESFSIDLGDGALAQTAGVSSGAVVGGVSGAATGLLDGVITGAVEGWRNPFTRESFLLDGPFLEYDPYELGAD